MQINKQGVLLEEIAGFSVDALSVRYTDITGVTIHIPMEILIRLYEGVKADVQKRRGKNWDEYCTFVMEDSSKW